jgi:mono/diheme cytochrome c family protein/small nuclear ribonucleoprotein (snRNP)-like protein
MTFLAAYTLLFGQQGSASGSGSAVQTQTQLQESRGALATRRFLGLGKLPNPKAAAAGAKIFAQNCSFCHGANARGANAPDLLTSEIVLDDEAGEKIGPVIQHGRPRQGMPAFASLTKKQRYGIAEFLHEQVELEANRGTYKVLNIVTGNSRAGEQFFNGAGRCNTCHSVTGDLAHIGSKHSAVEIQQALLYPRVHDRKVIVTLPNGTKMAGMLIDFDDFNIVFRDAQGDYHSIAMSKGVKVDLDEASKLAFHREMLGRYTNAEMHDLTAYLVGLK